MSSSAKVRGSHATPSPARAIESSVGEMRGKDRLERKAAISGLALCGDDPAQSRLRAIGQVFYRRSAVKRPARLSVAAARGEWHQRVGADHDAPELTGLEPAAHVAVMVTQQELNVAPQHHLLAGLHAVGDQIEITERQNPVIAAHPFREEREGERVRGRDRQRPVATAGDFRGIAAQLVQGARQDLGLGVKMLARRRQRHAVRGAGEQVRADPRFQRADPPAERGLGNMPRSGGPGKVQGFRQRQIVLEPDQLHR